MFGSFRCVLLLLRTKNLYAFFYEQLVRILSLRKVVKLLPFQEASLKAMGVPRVLMDQLVLLVTAVQ